MTSSTKRGRPPTALVTDVDSIDILHDKLLIENKLLNIRELQNYQEIFGLKLIFSWLTKSYEAKLSYHAKCLIIVNHI